MPSTRTKYRKLAEQVETGELVRIQKGTYSKPEKLFDLEGDFYKATLLAGKQSAVCLASALQYYGLLEQIIGHTWILVSHKDRPRSEKIKIVRSRQPKWKVGIVSHRTFSITNIERSIVDSFRYQKLVGIPTALHALKTALKEKQTTKSKIFDMAKKLGTEKRMIPYLESV